jgi:hypothetical protein
MEIKLDTPTTPPTNLPSPTPYPTPTNVVLPSFSEHGLHAEDADDGEERSPQRPSNVGGNSLWNLFSPAKEETPAEKGRRDSAMSLATPGDDSMSLASPAARHVSEPQDTPAETPAREPKDRMSFMSVFSLGSPTTPGPAMPPAPEFTKVESPAPAPAAVEVKTAEPKPAKACCVVC